MSVKIFTMTHKKFNPPADSLYVPLHVGRKCSADLGFMGDDTGDNISEKNPYYSELTGVYWVWKNVKDTDAVGICHYRRYLLNEEGTLFTRGELEALLLRYDVITTRLLTLNYPYIEAFDANHNAEDLRVTGKVIKEKYPDYTEAFERIVQGVHTYFGNMTVMSKSLFDEYCSWLFSILFEVERRIDISSYNNYQKRVFGFLSEILLYVWIEVRGLSVKECMVGMSGEKAETREMKERLSAYFRKKDIAGAKAYFMARYACRPDILMEASDTFGELKLSMQVISVCEFELEETGSCVLDRISDFGELMKYFGRVNTIVNRYQNGEANDEDLQYLKKMQTSPVMLRVSAAVGGGNKKVPEIYP